MKNRYTPFGYAICDGVMMAVATELNAVQTIFSAYADGMSCLGIANMMMKIGIRYRESTDKWNKSMVKRILDNEKYLGNDQYPVIIEKEIYEKVKYQKTKKYNHCNASSGDNRNIFKNMVICTDCGKILERKKDRSSYYWKCESVKITVEDIETVTAEKLKHLAEQPSLCEIEHIGGNCCNRDTIRLTNEIDQSIEEQSKNPNEIKNLILGCASAKYDAIADDDTEFVTERIKADISINAVKNILINHQGQITIKLKNGAIL